MSQLAVPRGSRLRVAIWALHLAAPLLGLWLLLAQPTLDVRWQHNLSHFLMVGASAVIAVAVGVRISVDARSRHDARLLLVSLAFLASAAFFGLHALSTPNVLVGAPNIGFVIATPVGLLLAGIFVAAACADMDRLGPAVMRTAAFLHAGLAAVVLAWATISVLGLPPLGPAAQQGDLGAPIAIVSVLGAGLFLVGVWRFWVLYRRRRGAVLMSLLTAWALLAESMAAVALGPSWQLSWWLWHVTMLLAFAFVAYAAWVQLRLDGTSAGLFDAVGTDATAAALAAARSDAVERVVAGLETAGADRGRAVGGGGEEVGRISAAVAESLGLSDRQRAILAEAGQALAISRGQTRMFRSYVSPEVGEAMVADPSRADLGGAIAEVTVLFADLQGFTAFSERHSPEDVVAMLNTHYGQAVPAILDEGGTVVQFVGDEIMAVFNTPVRQPDHAVRAARAALEVQRRAEQAAVALEPADDAWPRFRIGLNTGPALVGNIGAEKMRNFTAIGDTTNTGARIQAAAEPGTVLIGSATLQLLGPRAVTTAVGLLPMKGKADPVEVHRLERII